MPSISAMVAIPKAIAVGYVPTHWKPEDNSKSPYKAVRLNARGGKKMRNPEAALRVTPRQSAKIISIIAIGCFC